MLGHGGIVYISVLFGCDEKTTQKGLTELNCEESMSQLLIRYVGIENSENCSMVRKWWMCRNDHQETH
jgi:hypothetical protein